MFFFTFLSSNGKLIPEFLAAIIGYIEEEVYRGYIYLVIFSTN